MNCEDAAHYHGRSAWRGYVQFFSRAQRFYFKHVKGQRLTTCKRCRVKIPRQVPRVYLSGHWNYSAGHYCLKCAHSFIKDSILRKQVVFDDLTKNLKELEDLRAIVEECWEDEDYKKYMDVAEMMSKLTPRKVD